jgi:hypothetical protein
MCVDCVVVMMFNWEEKDSYLVPLAWCSELAFLLAVFSPYLHSGLR